MNFLQFVAPAVGVLMCAMPLFEANAEETKGKPNVFIDYMWHPSDVGSNEAEQLRNNVIQAINETGRVDLIDVDANDVLAIEKSRRESGLSAGEDAERLKVMEQQGANFLIQGRITSWVVDRKTTDDGSPYYTSVVNYTLKVINPNDGKLVHSQSFKAGDEWLNFQTGSTPEEAMMKVSKYAVRDVNAFIIKAFPVIGTILDVAEQKKDKVESVYISVGSDAGVAKEHMFEVCVERQIAGRTSQSPIGSLEVKSVEGGDISLAKVKKGHKEIKAALDGGQTIVIKSIEKKKGIGIAI